MGRAQSRTERSAGPYAAKRVRSNEPDNDKKPTLHHALLRQTLTTTADGGCECFAGGFSGEAIEKAGTVQTGGCHDEGAYRRVQPSVHPVPDSAVQDEDDSASRQARRRAQGPDRQVKNKGAKNMLEVKSRKNKRK